LRSRKRNDGKLVRIQAYIDEKFYNKIERAMEKLGMKTKAEFVRVALKEKLDRVGFFPTQLAVLLIPFILQMVLNDPLLLALSSAMLISLISVFAVRLVRAESPEERARAMRILSGFIIGGAMMALAKPIAFWLTGITYQDGTWYVGGQPADLPPELVSMIDRLLTLLQVIGVVVAIAAAIYGGIQLARRRRN